MKHIVVIFIIAIIGYVRGSVQLFTFPIDDESNYNSTCENANVAINFSGLEINRITKNFLSSPLVTYLDLSGSHISSVDPQAFINLPSLKYLNMSMNEFDINDIFSQSHLNLETLILDNIENIVRVQFNSVYPKLKRLFVRYNRAGIHPCPESKLENPFPALTHLYLKGTNVDNSCPEYLFQWLPNTLEYLDLSESDIFQVDLRNLDNLQCLTLNNFMFSVPRKLNFEGLNNLKYLSATTNNLIKLPSTFLSTLPSLIFLDLSENNIEMIKKFVMINTTNLQFINLSSNCIHSIEEEAFDNLANLEILDLGNNQISEIPTLSNEKLTALSFRYNELKKIAAGTFKKLSHIETLDLESNKISIIDRDAFIGLSNLKYLKLSNNLLMYMPPNWMMPIVSIKTLELVGNIFHDFEKLSLKESTSLEFLYLSDTINIKRSKFLIIPENLTVWILEKSDDKWTKTENIRECGGEQSYD